MQGANASDISPLFPRRADFPRYKMSSYRYLCVFLLASPILEAFANEYGSAGSTFLGIGLAITWLFQTLTQGRTRAGSDATILALYCAWMALTILWSVRASSTEAVLIYYLMMPVFYIIVYDLASTRKRILTLLSFFIAGIGLLAATAIGNVLSLNAYASAAGRYSAQGTDPNNFGMMVAMCGPLLLLLLPRRGVLWSGANIFGLGAVSFFVLSTGSRAAVAALFASLFLSFFFSRHGRTTRSTQLFDWTAYIAGGALLIFYLPDLVPEMALERLFEKSAYVAEDERLAVWSKVLESSEYFVLGAGAGTAYELLGIQIHNTFLSSLFEGGLIGVLLWTLFWTIPLLQLVRAISIDRASIFLLGTYTVLLVAGSTLNWEFRKPLYFGLAIFSAWFRVNRGSTKFSIQSQTQKQRLQGQASLSPSSNAEFFSF